MSSGQPGNGKQAAQPDRAAFAVALFLFVVAALVAWDAARLSSTVAPYARIGAAAFPYGIALLLAASGVATVVAAARGDFPDREPIDLGRVSWIVGGFAAQIALLGIAGFSIATGVLFAMSARGFGGRPLWLTFPVGVLLSFILYVAFNKGLQLSLPRGPLERLI